MDPLGAADGIESRFAAYVERLAPALGHADRAAPFRAYCTGLILPGDRKSVEPMAARVEPGRVGAAHQSLHHFVAKSAWDDAAVLAGVGDLALPALLERSPIRAWIIDDTGIPKKTTTLDALAETAKLRWRIERDCLELKQELGLGHYEGRGWRGFHHYATQCITAYGFLIRERAAIPPSGPSPSGRIETPDLPKGFRPRGAAIAP